jgi:hypothetical protein
MDTHIIRLIGEIDEFKGLWKGMEMLGVERLSTLRVLATIESIGSSTRIEGPEPGFSSKLLTRIIVSDDENHAFQDMI